MKIEKLRGQIDQIDDEILTLLISRLDLAMEIGEIKKQEQRKVYDPGREAAIKDKLSRLIHEKLQGSQLSNDKDLLAQCVMDIYKDIFTMSKRIQENSSSASHTD